MRTLDADTISFPSPAEYRAALLAVRDQLSDNQLSLLQYHYRAPRRTATARQLGEVVGYKDHRGVNGQHGKLAGKLCEALNVSVDGDKVHVLAEGRRQPEVAGGECQLIMPAELAQALQELGWV